MMCATSGEDCGKAFALFNAIDAQIVKDGLDWENLVSIGLDNTNSNMGNKNSVICPIWLPARVAPHIVLNQDLTVKTIMSIYTIEVVQNERVF